MEDCFLFKEGDRFLEAANFNEDWPAGRGIFHNESKTVLIWVGEEDHIRIFSMQRGHNVLEAYTRLDRVHSLILRYSDLAYSADSHLGYITCCPTNLGTALRASVHINLPKLRTQKPRFR